MEPAESQLAKGLFEEREKNVKAGKTDRKESVFKAPHVVFYFAMTGKQPMRYLVFHEEEPFRIEIAVEGEDGRNVYFGDEPLRKGVEMVLERAFRKSTGPKSDRKN